MSTELRHSSQGQFFARTMRPAGVLLVTVTVLLLHTPGLADNAPGSGAHQSSRRLCGPLCLAFCARWLGQEVSLPDVVEMTGAEDGEGALT